MFASGLSSGACVNDLPGSSGIAPIRDIAFYGSSDSLNSVPADISRDATMVSLETNQITKIKSRDFQNLTYCVELYLQYNSISEIDEDAFFGLSSLQKLYLDSNLLTVLKANMFLHLTALIELDLSNNDISWIMNGAFRGLGNLEILHLHSNRITLIEIDGFENLDKLVYLSMNGNQLTEIMPGIFRGLVSVKALRLEGNEFASLRESDFADFPRPLNLSLSYAQGPWGDDNPWRCTQSLCWLRKEEEIGTIFFSGRKPVCSNDGYWNRMWCQPDSE